MYKKILFPTDFSEYARNTQHCIEEIPGIEQVVLMHVVDARISKHGWIYGPQVEDAKIILEEEKGHIEKTGLKVVTKLEVVTDRHIADPILKIAEEENVDLIVLNARGKSVVKGILLGSVPLHIIRNTKKDVLIIRQKLAENIEFEKECPKLFSKVLYPTDFSELAEDGLSFLKNLGVQTILLLNVITKGETNEEIENNVKEAKNKLDEISEKFKDLGLITGKHVRVGHPTDEICSLAEEEDASLIAMSSHGKNWIKELLIGDTTFEVVRRAKLPVLVLRPK